MKQDSIIPVDELEAASLFAALGSEQRLSVLRTIVRAGPNGVTIGDLGERCGVRGSTLTHHLKILAQNELVEQSKQGRSTICLAVAYERLQKLSSFLLSECCADAGGCTDEEHLKDHHHG